MKDVSFYDVIIDKNDLKIISADAWIYDAFGSYAVKPMNELIAVEDIDIFTNNIKNCDGNWYPSKIICPDTMYYTYIRAVSENEKFIRLTIVNAKDLLTSHSTLMKAINTFKAHLNLYEDVLFDYDLSTETVSVYNTDISHLETGEYSLSEFENMLIQNADEDQQQAIHSFITQVRSGVGRSSTLIEGNILNDDEAVTNTVLEEAFVFYDRETEGVVGHIQPRRNKGSFKASAIKRDSLTGLVDKTDIIKLARERIDERRLEGTAVAIIDIDYFKSINDNYGHQFGDEVIKKIADIISSEVGNDGITGRFGGDEFFVVFYNIKSESELRAKLKFIKNMVSATFPDKGVDKDNPLSVSIGAAVFPKDADNYEDLFLLADHCVYLAKERGRNRYIFYTLEKHGTLDSIKEKHQSTKRINERDISYGDVIVKMFDMALNDKTGSLEQFMTEFAEAFELQIVSLFSGSPFRLIYAAGHQLTNDVSAKDLVLSILNSDVKDKYFALNDFLVVNRLETLPPYAHGIKAFLKEKGLHSFIAIRFYDVNNKECILLISSVGGRTQWNHTHFKYYRAFVNLLSMHSIG